MKTMTRLLLVGGVLVLGTAAIECSGGNYTPPPDMEVQVDLEAADLAVPPDMTTLPAPTITSVSPTSAVNNAMTPLTITGTNFRAGATVTVGGAACTQVTVVSPTQLTFQAPARPVGGGPVALRVAMAVDSGILAFVPLSEIPVLMTVMCEWSCISGGVVSFTWRAVPC